MQPCAACNRHVRDSVCPFCGATAVKREPLELGVGRFSRAMVFASATFAATAGCAHHQKQAQTPTEEEKHNAMREHPCGVDQQRVDEAQKKLDEAKTDEDKQAAQHELDDARIPVCAPYGAPPARRRVV